jgi:hypothetical protein
VIGKLGDPILKFTFEKWFTKEPSAFIMGFLGQLSVSDRPKEISLLRDSGLDRGAFSFCVSFLT